MFSPGSLAGAFIWELKKSKVKLQSVVDPPPPPPSIATFGFMSYRTFSKWSSRLFLLSFSASVVLLPLHDSPTCIAPNNKTMWHQRIHKTLSQSGVRLAQRRVHTYSSDTSAELHLITGAYTPVFIIFLLVRWSFYLSPTFVVLVAFMPAAPSLSSSTYHLHKENNSFSLSIFRTICGWIWILIWFLPPRGK